MRILENISTVMVSKALDAAVMRQQAIAQNLANVNTPGYRRLSVEFESQLAGLAQGARPAGALAQLAPRLVQAAQGDANPGADSDIAKLSETVLHHHALLKVLTKQMALYSSAVNEGKK